MKGGGNMRNHEVTERQKLLKDGQIAEPGWSRKMVQEYDRKDIKAPKSRIKEWDYYLIYNIDTSEYNALPQSSGTFRFINILYNAETKQMRIIEYDMDYVK